MGLHQVKINCPYDSRFPLLLVLLTLAACSKDAQKVDPALTKVKFRVQEVADKDQGGLIAVRFAAPQDWKASGLLEWRYNDLYTPVRFSSRAESPDGSAWIETYPAELFFWLDPRWDNFKGGTVGGIHQTNVTIQQAMQRYVIQRYRGKEKNLQILGYRPVSNLAKALNQPAISGEGIDFRVRYESGGETVDEEFFGLMTPKVTIPYHGPQGTTYEYHRTLALVHSIGAKGGKLESVRPLLGYMARSFEVDKVWEKQRDVVIKQLNDAYNRNLAAGYAQIEAAGRLSRSISANNDAMIRAMDDHVPSNVRRTPRALPVPRKRRQGSRGFRSVHPGHRKGGGFVRERLGTVQPVQLSLDGRVRKLRAFQRFQFRPQQSFECALREAEAG